MLSKKLVLAGFFLCVGPLLYADVPCADEVNDEEPYVAVGQPSLISKINLKRVDQARIASDQLIRFYRMGRLLLGGLIVGSLGTLLYNFFKPVVSVATPGLQSMQVPVSVQQGNHLAPLSEEEFRTKVSQRLAELEAHFVAIPAQEQSVWWLRVLRSYFEQVKVLSWAALYYLLQMATSSLVVAGVDRVVPLGEIGNATPSLTWFITNKTAYMYYFQESVNRLKEGFHDDVDYGIFCDSISMFVHEIERIMGYVESYTLAAITDGEVKIFLQDIVKKLHSATDEFVFDVLQKDGKRALTDLARLQRLVNNMKVICAG